MTDQDKITEFERALTHLINSHSMENTCNIPDFILAKFLVRVMLDFSQASIERESWFGQHLSIVTKKELK